ncbi:hypothetical protein SAMN04488542_103232 [Fontibacillus panacisegetis]|uniref:Uncharacterized protein n=1 Tax=Fontibacillus panacisegetis TaxID=670482 RepID=A0A1G7GWP3_9BACL|nr:hypothetical protein [Fontibacillus panacisegetis]SDE92580.1 hypothetical protein SAMN04488542_103232 [Fontibacillus panacisegetis]
MNTKTRMLNRKNNELDQKLNKENSIVMTDMVCYLRVANISEYHQEMVRQDLLQMVLSAQQRSAYIKEVIGEDYKAFCDEVIAALPPISPKERFLDFADIILRCIAILGVINIIISKEMFELIRNAVTGQTLDYQLSISVGTLLSTAVIVAAASFIVHFIGRHSFDTQTTKSKSSLRENIMVGSVSGGLTAVILLLMLFAKQTLFTVNIFIACLFILGIYVAHKILQNRRL